MLRHSASRRRRGGFAAVLAMMYLMLFSVLAIGFYAAAAMSVQIAANDRQAAEAQAAAESGLAFLTLQLQRIRIQAAATNAQALAAIEDDAFIPSPGAQGEGLRTGVLGDLGALKALTLPSPGVPGEGTNVGALGMNVAPASRTHWERADTGGMPGLLVPIDNSFITLDPKTGEQFRAELSLEGSILRIKVIGCVGNGTITRTIVENFQRVPDSDGMVEFKPNPSTYEEVAR